MTIYYQQILQEIKRQAPKEVELWVNERYHSNTHHFYGLRNPQKQAIAKAFYASHRDLSKKDFLQLLKNLYTGKSYEEKTIASELLFRYQHFWDEITLSDIDRFLNHLVGWAEIDNLCQSKIIIPFLEKDFKETSIFIRKLSQDKNINKRRASLVLLIKPAMYLEDKRIFDLAIETIERLKPHKEIIITKAISWLLRALTTHHKNEVKNYVDKNLDTLSKIAIRETLKKIETGKK